MQSIEWCRAMLRRCLSVCFAATILTVASGGAGAQPDGESGGTDAARDVVKRLHAALIEVAGAQADFGARYEALLPVVRATHNLNFIAELTIRRQWRDLDEAVRGEFADAFERLSVATYASRFATVGPETFRIVDASNLEDGRVQVTAEIVRSEQPNVALDYVLQWDTDGWRIVNILADGVSDLALKRAQYQRVFRDGGSIDDVISTIRSEADAL